MASTACRRSSALAGAQRASGQVWEVSGPIEGQWDALAATTSPGLRRGRLSDPSSDRTSSPMLGSPYSEGAWGHWGGGGGGAARGRGVAANGRAGHVVTAAPAVVERVW